MQVRLRGATSAGPRAEHTRGGSRQKRGNTAGRHRPFSPPVFVWCIHSVPRSVPVQCMHLGTREDVLGPVAGTFDWDPIGPIRGELFERSREGRACMTAAQHLVIPFARHPQCWDSISTSTRQKTQAPHSWLPAGAEYHAVGLAHGDDDAHHTRMSWVGTPSDRGLTCRQSLVGSVEVTGASHSLFVISKQKAGQME